MNRPLRSQVLTALSIAVLVSLGCESAPSSVTSPSDASGAGLDARAGGQQLKLNVSTLDSSGHGQFLIGQVVTASNGTWTVQGVTSKPHGTVTLALPQLTEALTVTINRSESCPFSKVLHPADYQGSTVWLYLPPCA